MEDAHQMRTASTKDCSDGTVLASVLAWDMHRGARTAFRAPRSIVSLHGAVFWMKTAFFVNFSCSKSTRPAQPTTLAVLLRCSHIPHMYINCVCRSMRLSETSIAWAGSVTADKALFIQKWKMRTKCAPRAPKIVQTALCSHQYSRGTCTEMCGRLSVRLGQWLACTVQFSG